jgi:hypothetical protein
MGGYQPMKIAGFQTGLVQEREEFLLPNDAYPVLQNAFVWRERIKRKQGTELLGRLQKVVAVDTPLAFVNGTVNLYSTLVINSEATIVPGSVKLEFNGITYTDLTKDGVLTGGGGELGSINYKTGAVELDDTSSGAGTLNTLKWNPNLPVMGILLREIDSENRSETIFFDTQYAYKWDASNQFIQFTGVSWNGTNYQLFWSTNYWVSSANLKLFWTTNFNIGPGTRDPIRYTDGSTWVDFAPEVHLNPSPAPTTRLVQCRALLPFRGRLLAFNTLEGENLTTNTVQYRQRIRWSAIGNPIADASAIVTSVNPNAWRDDIRGQGGFLDIPTSQDIISVGFVRDNLVIFCERSTWQLRYTGRSIQPFQVERVNSELGTESTFSSVQFDTSLTSFGDKGMTDCDSFKSDRIDIKIPDLVFDVPYENNNNKRIYGIRDFQQRLAYWAYPFTEDYTPSFNNKRLVYNYENDSWAIFEDSFTCFGPFQTINDRTWEQATYPWSTANFPWKSGTALFPFILGGNQQGFVSKLDQKVINGDSLYIYDINGIVGSALNIQSRDHNLASDQIIQINNIVGDFSYLNGNNYKIKREDDNNMTLFSFNPVHEDFDVPVIFNGGNYIIGGTIRVRDNFSIQSKKFNFMDDGQNIQLGYIDILLENTEDGEITLNVYTDYNMSEAVNTYPQNANDVTDQPDTFFNSVIPTHLDFPNENNSSTKNWQRIFCPTRAAFLTTEFTLSDAQMNGAPQESDVQIDAQIMWIRRAGKQLPIGV